ncbi:hypothetical protein [Rhodoferax sp.]
MQRADIFAENGPLVRWPENFSRRIPAFPSASIDQQDDFAVV